MKTNDYLTPNVWQDPSAAAASAQSASYSENIGETSPEKQAFGIEYSVPTAIKYNAGLTSGPTENSVGVSSPVGTSVAGAPGSSGAAGPAGPPGPAGTGGTPAGNNGEIQFNDNGAFGSDPIFTWSTADSAIIFTDDASILGAGGSGQGKSIDIVGGTGVSIDDGGSVSIFGGSGGITSGGGGSVVIQGGYSENAQGGYVFLTPGASTGGTTGQVQINGTLDIGPYLGSNTQTQIAGAYGVHILANTAGTILNFMSLKVESINQAGVQGGSIYVYTGNNAADTTLKGDFDLANDGALPTNTAGGFIAIPYCNGTPTGSPSGNSPRLIYDATNNKLYVHTGAGGWKSVTLT